MKRLIRLLPLLVPLAGAGCTCNDQPATPEVTTPTPVPSTETPDERGGKREGRPDRAGARGAMDPDTVWDRRQVVYRMPLVHLDPAVAREKLRAAFAEELGADAFPHEECSAIQVYDTPAGDVAKAGRSLHRIVRHDSETCASGDEDRVTDVVEVKADTEEAAKTVLEQLSAARTGARSFRIAAEAWVNPAGQTYLLSGHEPLKSDADPFGTAITAADGPLIAWALPTGEATARCMAPLQQNVWIGAPAEGPDADAEEGDEPATPPGGKPRGKKMDRSTMPFKRMRLVTWSVPGQPPVATEVILSVPNRIARGGEGPELVKKRLEEAGLLADTPPLDVQAWIDGCGR